MYILHLILSAKYKHNHPSPTGNADAAFCTARRIAEPLACHSGKINNCLIVILRAFSTKKGP